jgi:hypothetical protein
MAVFSTIIRSKYRAWLLWLPLLLGVTCVVYWLIPHGSMVELLIVAVVTSLLINLISSFLVIILIEERDRREAKLLEQTQQGVVISKLVSAIKTYNRLIANVLKATSPDPMQDAAQRSQNLYYETDSVATRLDMLDLNSDSYVSFIISPPPEPKYGRYTWAQVFITETEKYRDAMRQIQENYLFALDRHLIEPVDAIARLAGYPAEPVRSTCLYNPNQHQDDLRPRKIVFSLFGTMTTIESTKQMMVELDRLTGRRNFEIDTTTFTAPHVSPRLGSGVDPEFASQDDS